MKGVSVLWKHIGILYHGVAGGERENAGRA